MAEIDQVVESEQQSQVPPPESENNVVQEAVPEKIVTQSEFNKAMGAAKKSAYEQGRRQALAELQAQQQMQQEQQQQQSGQSMGGISQMPEDQIRQMIAEEAEKQKHQAVMQQVATDFTQKMMAAKDKYPDFEDTVSQLNLPTIPQIVYWANATDNTADVMYDIAKNPSKFANLLMLTHTAPHLAQKELSKLSESIKKNQAAQAQQQSTNEPLSQLKPSNIGSDNGSMSPSDYRKQPWLRA